MGSTLGELIDKLQQYVEVRLEQIKLAIITRSSKAIAGLITLTMILFFGLFVLFFLSLALAAYLNEVLDSKFLGYLLTAGCYLLVIIVMLLLSNRKVLQGWIETIILRSNENNEND